MGEKVHIESVGRQGDGVAETPQGRVHVAYTLPGENVEITREGDRALTTFIEPRPNPDRIAPVCRHYTLCGGCSLQHWKAEPYLAWKRRLVFDALAREGVNAEVAETIPAYGAGRTRAVFHAGRGEKKEDLGFAIRRSHEVVPIVECPVLDPKLEAALPIARELAKLLLPMRKPIDLHFTMAQLGFDIDIRGPGKLISAVESKVVRFAAEKKILRISRHGETVAQLVASSRVIGTARVHFPPAAFFQATEEGERVLAEKVMQAADDAKSAADLFSGIGTFALRMASKVKVAAFDNHEPSIAALAAAAKSPGLKPVSASVRDLFRWPLVADEMKKLDFVVLDPPRQGAEAQARELAKSKVKKIAYVSCDADSFARDARILIAGGYQLGAVTPVDQFQYSPHVELVGVFARK